mmetsp:Transcript_50196/g.132332  ORF Transcript_50196/g.132332 Transcript_50196/m.132332 type:complete len:651 (-) Transcript_50196:23-1975(-)
MLAASLFLPDQLGRVERFFTWAQEAIRQGAAKAKTRNKGIAGHWMFHAVVNFAIMFNCVQMGVELEMQPERGTASFNVFQAFEIVVLAIFLFEALVKWYHLRLLYFLELANWLDFLVVLVSLVDFVAFVADLGNDLSSVQAIRAIRLTRVLRLVRFVRAFKELTLILKGLKDVAYIMMWVAVLLFFIFYAIAILCVSLIGRDDTWPGYHKDLETIDLDANGNLVGCEGDPRICSFNNFEYFGTIGRSMVTLFHMFIFAETHVIGRAFWVHKPYFFPVVVLFSLICVFGVTNVVIGMVVDNTLGSVRQLERVLREQEVAQRIQDLQRLHDIIAALDDDGSGMITADEIRRGLQMPEVREIMRKIHIPSSFTAQDIITLLDDDGDNMVTPSEFLMSFFRLMDSDSFEEKCILHTSLNRIKQLARRAEMMLETIARKMEVDMAAVNEMLPKYEDPEKEDAFQALVSMAKSSHHAAQKKDHDRTAEAKAALEEGQAAKPAQDSQAQQQQEHMDKVHEKMSAMSDLLEKFAGQCNQVQDVVAAQKKETIAALQQRLSSVEKHVQQVADSITESFSAMEAKMMQSDKQQKLRIMASIQTHFEFLMKAQLEAQKSSTPGKEMKEFQAKGHLIAKALEYDATYKEVTAAIDDQDLLRA